MQFWDCINVTTPSLGARSSTLPLGKQGASLVRQGGGWDLAFSLVFATCALVSADTFSNVSSFIKIKISKVV